MLIRMTRKFIAKYVSGWALRRDQQHLIAIRARDGDNCRRCRRPMRFDLPEGHDKAPVVQSILSGPAAKGAPLDDLCLCHRRCNADSADNTVEIKERIRRKNEAELFSKSRKRARRRA
jgi:hypothetical protein